MAVPFGKREKIILGVILTVGAIAGLHFLAGFQDTANKTESAEQAYAQAQNKYAEIQTYPNKAKVNEIQENTENLQVFFWDHYFDLDVNKMYPFIPTDKEVTASEPETPTTDAIVGKKYSEQQVASWALICNRFDRLNAMRKAFESGSSWQGDDISYFNSVYSDAVEEQNQLTEDNRQNVMQMGFLWEPEAQGFPTTWRVPTQLPETVREPAVLWDSISELDGLLNILQLLPPGSEDYLNNRQEYLRILRTLGYDYESNLTLADRIPNWPEFRKLLMIRMMWDLKDPDEVIRLSDKNLTYPLLLKLFSVEMPSDKELYMMYRRLEMTEDVATLARLHGIESMPLVLFPQDQAFAQYSPKTVLDTIAKAAEKNKEKARDISPIRHRNTGPRIGSGSSTQDDREDEAREREEEEERRGSRDDDSSEGAMLSSGKNVGYMAVMKLVIIGKHADTIRFLDNLTALPELYSIDEIYIFPLPEGENRVQVSVVLSKPVVVEGLTSDKTLFTANAIAPKPFLKNKKDIAGESWVEMLNREKQRGINRVEIIQEELSNMRKPGNMLTTLKKQINKHTPKPEVTPRAAQPTSGNNTSAQPSTPAQPGNTQPNGDV